MNHLLIITYYWPPCGGVSVQRWLKLSKYLHLNDYKITILSTIEGDYPKTDISLCSQVAKEINVKRVKPITFTKIYKILLGQSEDLPYGSLDASSSSSYLKKFLFFLRRHFVSPDARIFWNFVAYKSIKEQVLANDFDVVITTGPPHSSHLIGLKLQKLTKVKWIADFRDPWYSIHYNDNSKRNYLIQKVDKYLENKVLSKADTVVTVSDQVSRTFSRSNVCIVPNGFDPDDYLNQEYIRTDKFRFKYIGSLHGNRHEIVFNSLKLIDNYASEHDIFNIEFSLIGAYDTMPEDIFKAIKNITLRNVAFSKHDTILSEYMNSEILLLAIENCPNNEGILTYKLFEYMGSRTKILGFGPKNSDAEKILEETGAGKMFNYDSHQSFIDCFFQYYEKWLNKENIKNTKDISDYSLPSLALKYANIIGGTHVK